VDLSAIVSERRHLINLAYRLLGSLAEAEDVVQETYARWYAMSREQQQAIATPAAWLTTVASRICLDLLGSARVRRERYVGEWIPEPLPGRADWVGGRPGAPPVALSGSVGPDDPADRVTLDESITMAFLVVLESMTPAERVALILHDVFGYSFNEVGAVVGRTPAACRQLATSARRRLRALHSPPTPAAQAQHAAVVRDFKKAWEAGDIEALVGLLDPSATLVADGGGIVPATLQPVQGAEAISRLAAWVTAQVVPLRMFERTVNGQLGLLAESAGKVASVMAFEVTDGRITHIWAVRNPVKLRPWTVRAPHGC
jgi:RNA polymerase sigma factor (sigma-70 family)